MAIVKLTLQNAWLLENQLLYTPAQREMAIGSRHLCYVLPKRVAIRGEKRKAVFERERGRCYHCNEPIDYADFHVDHLYPLSLGGGDEMSNLAASCVPCNLAKGASA